MCVCGGVGRGGGSRKCPSQRLCAEQALVTGVPPAVNGVALGGTSALGGTRAVSSAQQTPPFFFWQVGFHLPDRHARTMSCLPRHLR